MRSHEFFSQPQSDTRRMLWTHYRAIHQLIDTLIDQGLNRWILTQQKRMAGLSPHTLNSYEFYGLNKPSRLSRRLTDTGALSHTVIEEIYAVGGQIPWNSNPLQAVTHTPEEWRKLFYRGLYEHLLYECDRAISNGEAHPSLRHIFCQLFPEKELHCTVLHHLLERGETPPMTEQMMQFIHRQLTALTHEIIPPDIIPHLQAHEESLVTVNGYLRDDAVANTQLVPWIEWICKKVENSLIPTLLTHQALPQLQHQASLENAVYQRQQLAEDREMQNLAAAWHIYHHSQPVETPANTAPCTMTEPHTTPVAPVVPAPSPETSYPLTQLLLQDLNARGCHSFHILPDRTVDNKYVFVLHFVSLDALACFVGSFKGKKSNIDRESLQLFLGEDKAGYVFQHAQFASLTHMGGQWMPLRDALVKEAFQQRIHHLQNACLAPYIAYKIQQLNHPMMLAHAESPMQRLTQDLKKLAEDMHMILDQIETWPELTNAIQCIYRDYDRLLSQQHGLTDPSDFSRVLDDMLHAEPMGLIPENVAPSYRTRP